jgi:pimeloyl-ACP methyl ester carboxylesterase
LRRRHRALADKHGQPVSLIGWSLGGIYARELAKLHPTETRCVITLGTPFTGIRRRPTPGASTSC